ncbi:MAG: MerR family DNA-binding protein [Alphaproteobacteria bacterium]
MKAEDGRSEQARKKVAEWSSGTLVSRLNEKAKGAIVVVMQRLHEDDLSGHLLSQGGWRHLCLLAIATEDHDIPIGDGRVHKRRVGEVLQPEREDRATASCHQANSIAMNHLREVDRRIDRLQALRTELIRMVDECGHGHICDCRVIEVLADDKPAAQGRTTTRRSSDGFSPKSSGDQPLAIRGGRPSTAEP